jgi:dihydrofolate reductase
MFGNNKKDVPSIDLEQKELIENAQQRIKQKRGLFSHFIVFLVGSVGLIVMSQVLMENEPRQVLGVDWWVWVIFAWLLLLIYHSFKVFITNRLLGPEWEKQQYERLVKRQREKIATMKQEIEKEYPVAAVNPSSEKLEAPPKKTITMIAAADGNLGLGKDGDLVWHLPDDFKRFKALTTGHHIIMGRKTFESFPKLLPNRTHIILTRDQNYKAAGCMVVHDLETAIANTTGDSDPFIIGGGEIYKLALPYTDRVELTRIHEVFEVDTYFPELKKSEWKLIKTEHHPADDRHKQDFDYETWERTKKKSLI